MTHLHRVNHARRIIDLAGKLSATVAKRRNPKIFDTLTFMNGNLEREGVGVPGLGVAASFRKSASVDRALRMAAAIAGSLSATVAISSRAALSNMVWAPSGLAARRPIRAMNGVFPRHI